MAKKEILNIRDLIQPEVFSEINPCYEKRRKSRRKNKKRRVIIIPWYRDEVDIYMTMKSGQLFKMVPGMFSYMPYPDAETPFPELVRIFRRTPKEHQKFTAYCLSHELKIATMALNLARENPDNSVFEIGPDIGLASLYYHFMSLVNIPEGKPARQLRAFENDEVKFERANDFKGTVESVKSISLDDIAYILGDGIGGVKEQGSEGDIVFSSVAEPPVCEGIPDITRELRIRCVFSYSEATAEEVKNRRGCYPEDLFPNDYDVWPFEDKMYGANVREDCGRFGVVAVPRA